MERTTDMEYQTREFRADMTCEYSTRDRWDGIRAVKLIDCGPIVGMVAACQRCADMYERLNA
jgi:hypothetical protein